MAERTTKFRPLAGLGFLVSTQEASHGLTFEWRNLQQSILFNVVSNFFDPDQSTKVIKVEGITKNQEYRIFLSIQLAAIIYRQQNLSKCRL